MFYTTRVEKKVYYIRTDKLKYVDRQLGRIGFSYTRFSAIKGDERCGTNLLKGEVGCSLSHRQLWKMLLADTRTDWYLIFEDDIHIENDITKSMFETIMDTALKNYPELEFIAFGHAGCTGVEKEVLNHKSRFNLINGFVYCTHAYAINKKGARYLLGEDNTCRYPIDRHILEKYKKFPNRICRVMDRVRNYKYVGEGIVYQNRSLNSDIIDRTNQGNLKCI